MPKKTSRKELDIRSKRTTTQLELALTQASDFLRESMANRRAIDIKIYGLVVLSSSLLSLLIVVKPWSSKTPLSQLLLVGAFGAYSIVIGLGLMEYWPVTFTGFDPHAIFERLDEKYDVLVTWTTEELLSNGAENYKIARLKSRTLRDMFAVFVIAIACLLLGTLLN